MNYTPATISITSQGRTFVFYVTGNSARQLRDFVTDFLAIGEHFAPQEKP